MDRIGVVSISAPSGGKAPVLLGMYRILYPIRGILLITTYRRYINLPQSRQKVILGGLFRKEEERKKKEEMGKGERGKRRDRKKKERQGK